MGRSAQSKAILGMRDKQGFPDVPKEQKSMDDLGYFNKVKKLPRRLRGK